MTGRRLKHWGWGFEDQQPTHEQVEEAARGAREHLGFGAAETERPVPLDQVELPAPRLDPPGSLEAICRQDPYERALDSAGNVIVTGWTRSVDFPVLKAAQATLNNGVSPARYHAFVAKLSPSGDKLFWSTFLGGPDDDGAYALAVDSAGNAYLTGSVQSAAGFTGFKGSPTGNGAFIAKFDPQGAVVYSYFHPNQSFAGLGSTPASVGWMRQAALMWPAPCPVSCPARTPRKPSEHGATRKPSYSSSRRTVRRRSTRLPSAAA